MSKDTFLVGKLKECIEETVVFLRTLGQHKIPAVVERRRKELLDKLENAQGDTRKERPPKFEESPAKEAAPTPPVVKRAANKDNVKKESSSKREGSSESSSGITSPSKRDSKLVNNLVSGFETLHKTAKQEEEEQKPKKWNVELKKTPKPADFPAAKQSEESEEKAELEESRNTLEGSNELKPDSHHGSTHSLDSAGSGGEASGTPKGKRKKLAKFFKRGGRDKSPAPVRKETSTDEPAAPEEPEAVDTPPEPQEEGVKITGKLELKVKSRLSSKFVQKEVKVKEDTIYIGDKDSIALLGCTVGATDAGFDLVSHPSQKSHSFRVPSDSGHSKEEWVGAIQGVIDEVTPAKEPEATESNSADTVPTIEVSEPATPSDPAPEKPANDKASKKRGLEPKKPTKALPAQELIKGYIHRKKPGLTSRWEKTFCVVTYTAMYFTDLEGSSEYEHMFQINAGEATFTEKDKGHDKSSKSVIVKMGKKSEQLSIDKKEFSNWWSTLQTAYCFGESLEFNEEEDELADEPIEEDLYEEVISAPPVPSSPRPAGRPFIPEVSADDDIMIDEDIYEDTDEFFPREASEYQQPMVSAPQLPDRNPAQPKLPPRNTGPPLPGRGEPPKNTGPPLPGRGEPPKNTGPPLPGRGDPPKNTGPPLPGRGDPPKNTGPPLPGRGDPPKNTGPPGRSGIPSKPPAPRPVPQIEPDEDLYDDVVVKEEEVDENYDDVVMGEQEDLYDDVVVKDEPIQEEFYEDMAPGASSPQEDYVVMEHGTEDDDDDGELYVDVDHETPVAPPPTKPTPSPTPKSASPKNKGTFSRVFAAGRKTSTAVVTHSGQLAYKAPKKSKFENRHVTIEDTYLFVYKSSSDKKHQEKIALSDSALELGSTDTSAGQWAFRIIKSGKTHHFSSGSQEEQKEWLEVLKKLVKYAPANLGEQQVYQATEDHIADNTGQLTFKKGSYIRLLSKDSAAIWFGQLGNDASVFDGQKGKFPSEKVQLAEDMYI